MSTNDIKTPAEVIKESLVEPLTTIGDIYDASAARMLCRHNEEEKPIPLPWKSVAIALGGCDARPGGLWPGLTVLVGNTGSGKSQLALQAAYHAAFNNIPALYIGLELGPVDLVARLLGIMASQDGTSIKWSDLYLGRQSNLSAIIESHREELKRLPLYQEFGGPFGWDYTTLTDKVKQIREKHPSGPLLVVLDFLQIIAAPEKERRLDLRERIGRASYTARAAARDYDASIVLLSSTARQNYSDLSNEEPTNAKQQKEPFGKGDASRFIGLGKESGELEYSADCVLILGRQPHPSTERILGVAKCRAGKGGDWCKLTFDGNRFDEQHDGLPRKTYT